MFDHDEREAQLALHPAEQLAEGGDFGLGEAARRFVEQDDLGPVGQQTGQVDDAPLARGELAGALVALGGQVELHEELVDPAAHGRLAAPLGGGAQHGVGHPGHVERPTTGDGQRLLHGQGGEQLGVLERPAQAARGSAPRTRPP